MNQPKVQTDIPEDGAGSDANPTGTTPHGIPEGQADHEATASPTSDRQAAEVASVPIQKDSSNKA